jgi:hypothetical protein
LRLFAKNAAKHWVRPWPCENRQSIQGHSALQLDWFAPDWYSYFQGRIISEESMSVNQSDLDSFHQFAVRALAQQGEDLSLEDLLEQWRAQQDRAETIASVRRGVGDASAGRIRDAAEVDATIRTELRFPARQR